MKILLLEDDVELGPALRKLFVADGFEVVWVERLHKAQQYADTYAFHCIVTDLNLPDGAGFALIDALRARHDTVPILVMTSRADLQDRLKALHGGADDYVVKPFALEELLARVHAVIRRAHGFAGQLWRVGDLAIDVQQQTVEVMGVAIALTPREFAILRELAMGNGRVVPRDSLVDRIWGHAENPSDGAIEYQLHGLRRKIGAERIRTVRGVGYALVLAPLAAPKPIQSTPS
jgi:DNA-binding response OmpR family regulator